MRPTDRAPVDHWSGAGLGGDDEFARKLGADSGHRAV